MRVLAGGRVTMTKSCGWYDVAIRRTRIIFFDRKTRRCQIPSVRGPD